MDKVQHWLINGQGQNIDRSISSLLDQNLEQNSDVELVDKPDEEVDPLGELSNSFPVVSDNSNQIEDEDSPDKPNREDEPQGETFHPHILKQRLTKSYPPED